MDNLPTPVEEQADEKEKSAIGKTSGMSRRSHARSIGGLEEECSRNRMDLNNAIDKIKNSKSTFLIFLVED